MMREARANIYSNAASKSLWIMDRINSASHIYSSRSSCRQPGKLPAAANFLISRSNCHSKAKKPSYSSSCRMRIISLVFHALVKYFTIVEAFVISRAFQDERKKKARAPHLLRQFYRCSCVAILQAIHLWHLHSHHFGDWPYTSFSRALSSPKCSTDHSRSQKCPTQSYLFIVTDTREIIQSRACCTCDSQRRRWDFQTDHSDFDGQLTFCWHNYKVVSFKDPTAAWTDEQINGIACLFHTVSIEIIVAEWKSNNTAF